MEINRFLIAQNQIYDDVVKELINGYKRTHWIWFIFPQLIELSYSEIAKRYGIKDIHEAIAYWNHPVLQDRLKECLTLLLNHANRNASDILGDTDAQKLRSCCTLFLAASRGNPLIQEILNVFYDGVEDPITKKILSID